MVIKFTSPDYNLDYPTSQGGGKVVLSYDITVVAPGQDPLTQAYATTNILRALVTPLPGDEYQAELPSFSPSITNKDVQAFVREVRGDGGKGPYGDGSSTFYGGQPTLGDCDVISVV